MDALEKTTAVPETAAPRPEETASPAIQSCRSTAAFPPNVVRPWLRDRRILAGAGLAVGGSGLALGWDWPTAVGIAPLILSAAPCLVMCVLGLCMMGRGHQTNSGTVEPIGGKPAAPSDGDALR